MTEPCPQVFSVNGSIIFDVNDSIICSGLHFWRHFDVNGSIICSGLHFWRHWFNMTEFLVNSSCLWWIMRVVLTNQKYFEWIINCVISCCHANPLKWMAIELYKGKRPWGFSWWGFIWDFLRLPWRLLKVKILKNKWLTLFHTCVVCSWCGYFAHWTWFKRSFWSFCIPVFSSVYEGLVRNDKM